MKFGGNHSFSPMNQSNQSLPVSGKRLYRMLRKMAIARGRVNLKIVRSFHPPDFFKWCFICASETKPFGSEPQNNISAGFRGFRVQGIPGKPYLIPGTFLEPFEITFPGSDGSIQAKL